MLADTLRHHRLQLDSCTRLLESYSYEGVLARGFALVRDAAGGPVVSAAAVAPGQELHLQFHDGEIAADKPVALVDRRLLLRPLPVAEHQPRVGTVHGEQALRTGRHGLDAAIDRQHGFRGIAPRNLRSLRGFV